MTTTRTIGRSGREISAIGLGCMGLSEFYGPRKEANDAKKLIDTAIDLGVTLQVGNASEIYEHPNCRFVADFIGDTNFMDGTVAEVDGTWKLAQNKPPAARHSAAGHLNGAPIGQETALLAALMLGVDDGE